MPNFSNNAITDSGRVLLSHINMGAVFTPTRIILGSGYMPAGKTPRTMTEVVTPVKSLTITKKERTNDGKMIVGGYYSNADIEEDWEYRELALYAKAVYYNEDGSVNKEIAETCYSYGNAGDEADTMYAYTSGQPVERQMDLAIYVGNDATVNMTIASGTYEASGSVAAHNESEDAHSGLFNAIKTRVKDLEDNAFSGSYNDLKNVPESFPPASHNQPASTITEGTFYGAVAAKNSGQTPGTMLLRNSKLVIVEETPAVNGEIAWICK